MLGQYSTVLIWYYVLPINIFAFTSLCHSDACLLFELKRFIISIFNFIVLITWILTFSSILPFKGILLPSNYSKWPALILNIFSGIIRYFITGSPYAPAQENQSIIKEVYIIYIRVESIVISSILTIILAFFKNIYDSVGPIYEDQFYQLIGQGNEYANNFPIIFSFLLNYALPCIIPSALFMYSLHYYT